MLAYAISSRSANAKLEIRIVLGAHTSAPVVDEPAIAAVPGLRRVSEVINPACRIGGTLCAAVGSRVGHAHVANVDTANPALLCEPARCVWGWDRVRTVAVWEDEVPLPVEAAELWFRLHRLLRLAFAIIDDRSGPAIAAVILRERRQGRCVVPECICVGAYHRLDTLHLGGIERLLCNFEEVLRVKDKDPFEIVPI